MWHAFFVYLCITNKNGMKKYIILTLILISNITMAQEEPITTPQIGISISLGETVQIGDVFVEFEKVLEDSRCPEDVTCVWAGQAKVKVNISGDGITTDSLEVLFAANSNLRIGELDEFYIDAMALTPYPTSVTKGSLDYVLLVRKFPKKKD